MTTVTLPLWLAVSQWVLLFALGGLVFIMYRQLGYMLRIKDAGSDRDGLPIGATAPAFDYLPAVEGTGAGTRFDPQGVWSLLLFADPGCLTCQGAVTALNRLAPKLQVPLRLFVVTDASPAAIAAVDVFRKTTVPISRVSPKVAERLYQTTTTPFAFAIDPAGVVQAKGVVIDEPAIRKVVGKVEQIVEEREAVAS